MERLLGNDVVHFIRTELPHKLAGDFSHQPFRIFRERDLQACVYYHLRKRIRGDHRWVILNEPLLRGLKGRKKGAHPDLAILRNERLQFLIELKFHRRLTGIERKDQKVLKRAVGGKKWAKKAFYIEAVVRPTHRSKRELVAYRNQSLSVTMDPERVDEYLEVYRRMRKPKPRRRKRHAIQATRR